MGVLAAHGLLLIVLAARIDEMPRGAAPQHSAPALQVRALAPTPARAQAPAESPSKPPPVVALRPAPKSVARAAIAAEAPAAAEAAPSPPATPGEVPIYRTLPPPPFALAYTLQRGAERGSLELRWDTDGDRYEAQMTGTLGGRPLLTLRSSGTIDAAGIAPQRHTDRRRGRSLQAANFQRDAGRITFSGPATELALPPGVQDRLSWLLQLSAIVAADPALVAPGGRIVLVVVGVRGDADVWTFAHGGLEPVTLADAEPVPTVRLLREPEHAYDTRAEVWLDPARHYLPLRARLSNRPSGSDALEFEFRTVLAP